MPGVLVVGVLAGLVAEGVELVDVLTVLVTEWRAALCAAVPVAAEATPTAPAPRLAESTPVRMSRRALVAVMVAIGCSFLLDVAGP